jgi:3-deoxy-D-manno-octulosonic-acid transferase
VRYLYSVLYYLSLPLILLSLLIRSYRMPAYRKRIKERLGFYSFPLANCIWIHAVSVGETMAAIPLVKALQSIYPDKPFLITTMTPTGSERVKAVFNQTVSHVYLPYDFPGAVKRFYANFKPSIGIMIETELWPNLLAVARGQAIPMVLVNARLSEKSLRGYLRIAHFSKAMCANLSLIATQAKADCERFKRLGARNDIIKVTGNIKFDVEIPQDIGQKSQALRKQLGCKRPIWIAASTHEGEEKMLCQAQLYIRSIIPNALLVLVPRHPNRFALVETYLQELQLQYVLRSQAKLPSLDTSVYLADSMGELMLLYGSCDIAFIGGSLIPRGGHNMLEPAVLAKAILTGPYLFNFAEISQQLIAAKAMVIVNDGQELAAWILKLMQQPMLAQTMGQNGREVVQANRGALSRNLLLLQQIISATKVNKS